MAAAQECYAAKITTTSHFLKIYCAAKIGPMQNSSLVSCQILGMFAKNGPGRTNYGNKTDRSVRCVCVDQSFCICLYVNKYRLSDASTFLFSSSHPQTKLVTGCSVHFCLWGRSTHCLETTLLVCKQDKGHKFMFILYISFNICCKGLKVDSFYTNPKAH